MSKISEAKAALQKAMDALDAFDAEEKGEGEDEDAEDSAGDDDGIGQKTFAMKLQKYKEG